MYIHVKLSHNSHTSTSELSSLCLSFCLGVDSPYPQLSVHNQSRYVRNVVSCVRVCASVLRYSVNIRFFPFICCVSDDGSPCLSCSLTLPPVTVIAFWRSVVWSWQSDGFFLLLCASSRRFSYSNTIFWLKIAEHIHPECRTETNQASCIRSDDIIERAIVLFILCSCRIALWCKLIGRPAMSVCEIELCDDDVMSPQTEW